MRVAATPVTLACNPAAAEPTVALPGYAGHGDGNTAQCNIFYNRSRTANYIVEWIQCAQTAHNLEIDWVGVHNESPWDAEYLLTLRQHLDERGFQSTKIIAPDGSIAGIAKHLAANKTVARVVDALGSHYPGARGSAETSGAAMSLGIPLWASEDYSTYSDANGAGYVRLLTRACVSTSHSAKGRGGGAVQRQTCVRIMRPFLESLNQNG